MTAAHFAHGAREALRQDGEFILFRSRSAGRAAKPTVLLLAPVSAHPSRESRQKLAHELSLKADLDPEWAAVPLALVEHEDRPALLLDDAGGEPLHRLIHGPMEPGRFLRLAAGIARALRELHARNLIHKDVKPANVLVDAETSQVRLMGFGIASRLPRERQAAEPPELIAGTLAYMAPEQTGRMNRSVDSRSDLYALGVTLYEMLTGDAAVHGRRSDGMGALPRRETRRCRPTNACADGAAGGVRHRDEAAREDARGPLPDGGGRRARSAALSRRMGGARPHRRHSRSASTTRPIGCVIPEKLYGRAREVETLLAAFDRVVSSGTPELVLGLAAIPASASRRSCNELHKALVPPRGLFAAASSISTSATSRTRRWRRRFRASSRHLLAKSDAELARWRDALARGARRERAAHRGPGPRAEAMIGDQPPVPELAAAGRATHASSWCSGGSSACSRRPEHPLALFLDDLQWLDAATLDLLEDLMTAGDVRHLLAGADRAHRALLRIRARSYPRSGVHPDPAGRARRRHHLRIGRLLAAHTPAEKQEEAIFEIVNQLNRCTALITSADEREQLAQIST